MATEKGWTLIPLVPGSLLTTKHSYVYVYDNDGSFLYGLPKSRDVMFLGKSRRRASAMLSELWVLTPLGPGWVYVSEFHDFKNRCKVNPQHCKNFLVKDWRHP